HSVRLSPLRTNRRSSVERRRRRPGPRAPVERVPRGGRAASRCQARHHLRRMRRNRPGPRSHGARQSTVERRSPLIDPSLWPPYLKPRSKESILREADSLRGLARKARRLVATATDTAGQDSLSRHIKDLEANAIRLEKAAVDAKSG